MMIVTHEMNFARAICNRVFYMDQGGIYEDGPPEQIFDHPEKELTRRFIRKLKVLELTVDNTDCNFTGASDEIDRFCLQNNIPRRMRYRIGLVFEELTQQILIPVLQDPHIRFIAEYSEQDDCIGITVQYNGEPFDPEETINDLSYTMLKNAVTDLQHTIISEDGFTNRIECRIRE